MLAIEIKGFGVDALDSKLLVHAYAAASGTFEFVVADAGVGVLASLQQSPEYAELADSGEALRIAVSDGASRHGRASGRGHGIGQLFRALAHDSQHEDIAVGSSGRDAALGAQIKETRLKL